MRTGKVDVMALLHISDIFILIFYQTNSRKYHVYMSLKRWLHKHRIRNLMLAKHSASLFPRMVCWCFTIFRHSLQLENLHTHDFIVCFKCHQCSRKILSKYLKWWKMWVPRIRRFWSGNWKVKLVTSEAYVATCTNPVVKNTWPTQTNELGSERRH